MLWLAHLSLFLVKVARAWPIKLQRLEFQLKAIDVAIDAYTYHRREDEVIRLTSVYTDLFHAIHGDKMEGEAGVIFMARTAELGALLIRYGHSERGEAMLARATSYLRQAVLDDKPALASCVFNIGATLLSLDRPQDALEWMLRACDMRTRIHGADSFELAQCHNNLGCCLKDLGRYQEAEQANREAIRLHTMHLGKNSQEVAGALNNLAETLLRSGRAAEALPVILQSTEKMLRSDSGRCTVFDTLSDVYYALDRIAESVIAGRHSIESASETGQPLKAIEYSQKYAERLERAGRSREAAECSRWAEDLKRRAYFAYAKEGAAGE